VLYTGNEFRIDCYNLEGQQRGFHRGLDEDEIWFQFRGHAANDTEWGVVELDPGEMAYVPRGIAHRINGGKGFLRMVFYSRQLVHPKAFNSSAGRHSNFEVQ
jgi:homogentisate 1,2-dioxygenase